MQSRGVVLGAMAGRSALPTRPGPVMRTTDTSPRRRRDRVRLFLVILVFAAASQWAAAQAGAESQPVPLVAFLSGASVKADTRLPAFHKGMREHGYVEKTGFTFEARGADSRFDRLPSSPSRASPEIQTTSHSPTE